jgi:hypothetical protein
LAPNVIQNKGTSAMVNRQIPFVAISCTSLDGRGQ